MTDDKTVTMSRELAEEIFGELPDWNTPAGTKLSALLVAKSSAATCGHCNASTTDICNQNGCGYLESGNGAPVVERQPEPLYPRCTILNECNVGASGSTQCNTSPPAPVAVVLPDLSVIREYHLDATIRLDRYAADADMRKSDSEHYRKRAAFHRDQVATIDKLKELNQ
jgi:hypothetical protein